MHDLLHIRNDWNAQRRYADARECGRFNVQCYYAAGRTPSDQKRHHDLFPASCTYARAVL